MSGFFISIIKKIKAYSDKFSFFYFDQRSPIGLNLIYRSIGGDLLNHLFCWKEANFIENYNEDCIHIKVGHHIEFTINITISNGGIALSKSYKKDIVSFIDLLLNHLSYNKELSKFQKKLLRIVFLNAYYKEQSHEDLMIEFKSMHEEMVRKYYKYVCLVEEEPSFIYHDEYKYQEKEQHFKDKLRLILDNREEFIEGLILFSIIHFKDKGKGFICLFREMLKYKDNPLYKNDIEEVLSIVRNTDFFGMNISFIKIFVSVIRSNDFKNVSELKDCLNIFELLLSDKQNLSSLAYMIFNNGLLYVDNLQICQTYYEFLKKVGFFNNNIEGLVSFLLGSHYFDNKTEVFNLIKLLLTDKEILNELSQNFLKALCNNKDALLTLDNIGITKDFLVMVNEKILSDEIPNGINKRKIEI